MNLENFRPPEISKKRIAVRLLRSAQKHIRNGHPWVFDNSIESLSHEGQAGDLAVIFDHHRRFRAIGLYDPASPIRIKVLHAGDPVQIDASWFGEKLQTSLAMRSRLAEKGTSAYRCINGENDGLPSLIVDRYNETYVIKLYSAMWYPHLHMLLANIVDLALPERIVLRLSRRLQDQPAFGLRDGMTIFGEPPDGAVLFTENGLTFEADVVEGQKTGFFLDQRDNRAKVAKHAGGKDVLDVFASTGGFSVYAASGGARSVTAIDLSRPTLEAARRNMAHNLDNVGVAECDFQPITADAFDAMRKLARQGNRYGMVIIDPPSFAQKQTDIESALHAYARLTELGISLLAPGGILVQASCSSRVSAEDFYETVLDTAKRSGRSLREIVRTGHAIDHPVSFKEGAYLKALFAHIQ